MKDLTLQDITTRELLGIRLNQYYADETILIASRLGKGGEYQNVFATIDEVRQELVKRPHISSKKEAKLIRRLKSQTGQSEEWLRKHPRYGQEIVDAQKSKPRLAVSKQQYDKLATYFGADVAENRYRIN